MKKKIKPSDVTMQFEWDLGALSEFCAEIMEDANGHNVSGALSALSVGDHDLACEFIQLDKAHVAAGSLTQPLFQRRNELIERLIKLSEGR